MGSKTSLNKYSSRVQECSTRHFLDYCHTTTDIVINEIGKYIVVVLMSNPCSDDWISLGAIEDGGADKDKARKRLVGRLNLVNLSVAGASRRAG